jgi:hypothetical protein
MPELMQERPYLPRSQQGWVSFGRRGEVHDEYDVWAMILSTRSVILLLEVIHPSPTLLPLPREEVRIE